MLNRFYRYCHYNCDKIDSTFNDPSTCAQVINAASVFNDLLINITKNILNFGNSGGGSIPSDTHCVIARSRARCFNRCASVAGAVKRWLIPARPALLFTARCLGTRCIVRGPTV